MTGKLSKLLALFLVFTTLLTCIGLSGNVTVFAADDEYDTLRQKYANYLKGGNYDTNDPDIASKINIITSDAQDYWNSINKDTGRTCLWNDLPASDRRDVCISSSYSRLFTMSLAYSINGSSLKDNAALLSDIKEALDWLDANWYNSTIPWTGNWWHWIIGAPATYGNIVTLLYNDLTAQQIADYTAAIDHYIPDPWYQYTGLLSTGANRLDECLLAAVRGIIGKSDTKIARARDGVSAVLPYVTSGDGFYSDGSFIQHSNIAYTLSYGNVLLGGVANIMYLLNGSTWTINDQNKANVYKWVYDSFEPVIYKGAGMDMVRGRAVSREGESGHNAGVSAISSIIKLAQFAPDADAANYKSMVKRWINEDTYLDFYSVSSIYVTTLAKAIMNDSSIGAKADLNGNYEFTNMARTVSQKGSYAFGISKSSNKVARYEYGTTNTSSENQQGWYEGEGMTYLYNSDLGQYADDFWPTVNYYRLPGTTVDTHTRTKTDGAGTTSNNWAGGTTLLGTYGASGMDLSAYGSTLKAKKSWFMFDGKVVCLGAGINSTDSRTIETIVEQRMLDSSGSNTFTVNGTAKSTSLGWSETMTGVNWAHLAGNVPGSDVGYYFPESSTVKGLRQAQNGSWYNINTDGPADVRTKNYLTLWFDHGLNPRNATYSYVILPDKTATQVSSYAANPDITVLENSAQAQCVKEKTLNIVAANFWEDAYKTADIITSNRKASVLVKETAGLPSTLDVAVSDPTKANTGTINIEINKTASSIVSNDPQITVNQLSPTIKLTVNVNSANGKSFNAKFNLINNESTTIAPEADAYVMDGSNAATNYGLKDTLVVKNDGVTGYNRESFLRFNLSGITSNLVSAKVKIYSVNSNTTASTNIAEEVVDNTWGESTLTWNNKPGSSGTVLGSWTTQTGAWVTVDVTSAVQTALLKDKKLSLRVYSSTTGSTADTSYASKENTTASYRPCIEVLTNNRVPLTVTGITAADKVYDGTAAATLDTASAVLTGVAAGDDVTLNTTSATGSFEDKNVGKGKAVAVVGLTLTGTDAAKYTINPCTTTADITQKSVYITGIKAANKTYDGTTAATINASGVKIDTGLIQGDAVTVSTSNTTAVFADSETGAGKTVIISGLTLSGKDAANYSISGECITTADIVPVLDSVNAEDKVQVKPVGVTVTATSDSEETSSGKTNYAYRVIDNNLSTRWAAADSVYPHWLKIDLGRACEIQKLESYWFNSSLVRAYKYKVEVSSDDINYTEVVDKMDNTIVGGSTVPFTDVFYPLTTRYVRITVTGSTRSSAQAGLYEVHIFGSKQQKTPLNVTGITANSKIYDGTTAAILNTNDAVLNGVTPGDTVTLNTYGAKGDFTDKNAGIGKTVTVSGLTLSGADAEKYTLNGYTTTADISPKEVSATGITANSKVYDGTTVAALNIAEAALSGTIPGDVVSLDTSNAIGTFENKEAGINKTVVISGLTLAGADAGNYTLVICTTKANISEAQEPQGPVMTIVVPESIKAGNEFAVSIGLIGVSESVYSKVYAEDITVSFDTNLFEYISVQGANDKTVVASVYDSIPGSIRILVSNDGGISGDIQLMSLVLKAKNIQSTASGSIAVTKAELRIVPNGGIIQLAPVQTSVTVTALDIVVKHGDVNQDGIIDIRDLALAASYYLLDSSEAGWDKAKYADINNNGRVDVSDLYFVAIEIINQ